MYTYRQQECKSNHKAPAHPLKNGLGNQSNLLQMKLIKEDMTEMNGDDLEAPGISAQAKDVAGRLILSPEPYYLSVLEDFTGSKITALENKKYILGEDHRDNSWAERTQGFPHINKMLEALKGYQPESEDFKQVMIDNGLQILGQGREEEGEGTSYPLEGMNEYFLTTLLRLEMLLARYNDYVSDEGGIKEINIVIDEFIKCINSYTVIADGWMKLKSKALDKDIYLVYTEITQSILDYQLKDNLNDLKPAIPALDAPEGPDPADMAHSSDEIILPDIEEWTISNPDLDAAKRKIERVQIGLKGLKAQLLKLIEKNRKWYQSSSIIHKTQIEELSKPKKAAQKPLTLALELGNTVREPKMIDNVKQATAPLLVQTGDAHVNAIASGVGAEAIAVPEDADFLNMLQRS